MKNLSTKFLKRVCIILIPCFLLCNALVAQTNVGSDTSRHWVKSLGPYKLTSTVTVPAGQTLLIDPGTEVDFTDGTSQLIVLGTLTAQGTSTDSIKFIGGNYLYTSSQRGPITFDANSKNSVLKYVIINALGYYSRSDIKAALIVNSSSCSISNCTIQNINGTGIKVGNVYPKIESNKFISNLNMDVSLDLDKLKILSAKTNNALKIGVTADFAMSTSDTLLPYNLYYRLLANQTIPQTKTLVIDPGVQVQFQDGTSQLLVQGTLKAVGTSSAYINFAGGNYVYTSSQRGPVIFDVTSQNSILQYVTIDALGYYGRSDIKAAIIANSASCNISNCNIQNINGTGIKIGNVYPKIENNTFTANLNMDVSLDLDKLKVLSSNTNNPLKIGLTADFPMGSNDVLSSYNLYYRLLANQTIPQTKTLSIEPGVQVQFADGSSQVLVQGTLKAVGNSSNYINFTGGNYVYTSSQRGPVIFDVTSQNSVLQYVTVDALGYYARSDIKAAIIANSGSCNINNCNIQNINGTGIKVGNVYPKIGSNLFNSNLNMDVSLDLDKLKILSSKTNNPLKIGLTADFPMGSNDSLSSYNSYYRLLANQTITQTKTLVIDPGVEVQFPDGGSQMLVQGTVKAVGTANAYIQFTGGNYIYTSSQRGPVVFDAMSENSTLQFVTIDALGYYNNRASAVVVKSSSTSIYNSTFTNSRGTALGIQNSASPSIVQSCFYTNAAGAVISTGGTAKFRNCNFLSNKSGIVNTSATDVITATNCWWGDATGPYQRTTNPNAVGDSVSNGVLYKPFAAEQFDCNAAAGPLSVTLLNFQALSLNGNVVCDWQTAIEINTSHFTIEHSIDGANFSGIGNVDAAGNSAGTISYEFIDKKPNNGNNYYRLKSVDIDGKYTYSKVVRINIASSITLAISPNPARNNLFVQIQRNETEKVVLQITDMAGKVLCKQTQQLQKGITSVSLNTSVLSKGMYLLLVKGKNGEAKTFMKE